MTVRYVRLLFAAALLAALAAVPFGGCALSSEGTLAVSGTKCNEDATCDDGNPCTIDACGDEGLCVVSPAADGDAPAQTPGDCKRLVCAGGALIEEPDDLDVVDDGNACTFDDCGDGKVLHTPKAGSPCAIHGANGVCSVDGECVVDCGPGLPPCNDGEPCTTDACNAAEGKCVFTPLDGVACPGVADVPGDCRTPLCVQGTCPEPDKGGVVDDTDLPVDGNDCTTDACASGIPSNVPLPGGTSCETNGGKICDSEGGGQCVECNSPADCTHLPEDDACKHRTCIGHKCGIEPMPDGTLVPGQPAGDCQKLFCQAGEITQEADDTDVPVDNNACTKDLCTAGVPSNPPEPPNTSCGDTLVCNGAGQCVGCVSPETCPGVDDFCKKRTCEASVCGFAFTKDGTVLPQQQVGDCLELQCDGLGNVKAAIKNTDLPLDDGNQCTNETCVAGAPSHPPTPINSPCNQQGGKVCDGNKSCVQCNDPIAHCPAPPACKAAACTAGKCGTVNLATGATAQQQSSGDCKINLCDGQGNVVPAPDDGDVPVDGKECTSDVCSMGQPSNPPVAAGQPCGPAGGGQQCDGKGTCKLGGAKACQTGDDCASGFCSDGVCCDQVCTATCKACNLPSAPGTCSNIPAQQGDLNATNVCTDSSACDGKGVCKKANGQTCMSDGECASGACVDGFCCNTPCTGVCQACSFLLTEAPNGVCSPIAPGKQDGSPACDGVNACDGSGKCKLVDAQPCMTSDQCVSGHCVDGVCCESACTTTCKTCNLPGQAGKCLNVPQLQEDAFPANACTGASACDGSGACRKDVGESCTKPTDCANGICVDGFCCEDACTGTCEACSNALTGKGNGTCEPIQQGKEDASPACNGPSACDGVGACKKKNGQACVSSPECASGFCKDGVCCESGCTLVCMACSGALTGKASGKCEPIKSGTDDTDPVCSGATTCNGSGACKKKNGEVCSIASDCLSGHCKDGVCCEAACTGTCQACSLALTGKQDGKCDFIEKGKEDGDPVCGGNMSCDGAGSCKKDDGESCTKAADCSSGHCVDGICCEEACGGACMACSNALTGKPNGQCEPVKLGTPDANGTPACSGANVCDGAGACKKANGQACQVGSDCATGFCPEHDKVCCDKACDGTCEACTKIKTGANDGVCALVTTGTDPDDECADPKVCNGGACQ